MSDFQYGTVSLKRLETCHTALMYVAVDALKLSPYDITIVHGWRGEDIQNALFDSNASGKRWPDSKHNNLGGDGQSQSEAIDFAPWVGGSVPWDDTHIFAVIAGSFFAAAADHGVILRWGGDWDGDGSTKDQKLMDWGHVEIIL
jgi:peptidoglycan L-alanyl-D-glutamate endopeptidase CwlK